MYSWGGDGYEGVTPRGARDMAATYRQPRLRRDGGACPWAASRKHALTRRRCGCRSVNWPISRYYWDSVYFIADTLTGGGAYNPTMAPQAPPSCPLVLF